jgi:hypothetical protein
MLIVLKKLWRILARSRRGRSDCARGTPSVPEAAALVVAPKGRLVEQYQTQHSACGQGSSAKRCPRRHSFATCCARSSPPAPTRASERLSSAPTTSKAAACELQAVRGFCDWQLGR